MNKIKENKKLFVIILIISLIAILLGSYAIYKNSNKDKTTSKIEKSEKLEKKAEKKLKEAKKSGDKEKIEKAEKELKEAEEKTEEIKKEKTGNSSKANTPSASSSNASTSKSTPTATKPSTNSSSATSSTSKPSPKPKEKQKVWIVDKSAWVETVVDYDRPVETWIAVDDASGIERKFYDYAEAMSPKGFPESGLGHVYNGETEYPYTKTINHPEEGHYEYR